MKYTAYEIRKTTDTLFAPQAGSAEYRGRLADAVSYTEKEQLLDPALWALFVEQFRLGNVDDHDFGWRSEYWGKMMRGACFTYAYTQNEALYRVLEDTARDLLTTQDRYGRISCYSIPCEFHGWDIWGRKYVMLGYEYFLEICRDDGLADEIVSALCRHANYMLAKIGDGVGKLKITNTSEWWEGLNASSILEPFVRLYDITKEEKYLAFAREIIDAGGMRSFDLFEAALEGNLHPYEYPVTKAYEMISNFEGILEYYRVTGEEKYLTMTKNFARLVMESDITVIGSAGTTHELFDHSRVRQFDPKFDGIMQETCVTVTWMKFLHQLLCLTGDPVYADEIERSAYNALLGAINTEKRAFNGQVFTFDSYSPLLNNIRGRAVGGYKDIRADGFHWGCCVAIAAAGTALVPMTAVMQARDGVCANLYLSGESRTRLENGTLLTLTADTAFPKAGNVTYTVSPERETAFVFSVRIPAWSKKTELSVNGEKVPCEPGTYARIDRIWKMGDTVTLALDMRVKITTARELDPEVSRDNENHICLTRGPVVLARDERFGGFVGEEEAVVSENGYAEIVSEVSAPFTAEQAYTIRTEDGSFPVVDYASAGQYKTDPVVMTAWITTK